MQTTGKAGAMFGDLAYLHRLRRRYGGRAPMGKVLHREAARLAAEGLRQMRVHHCPGCGATAMAQGKPYGWAGGVCPACQPDEAA